ncbi:aldehyde dehydrogenase family protein [Leucobacter sp. gxy201]|uniref:aldehyde dehydrogenase family protein n=1 Tax=Leucobacter sp. gxy201 TaxID=2957200 RepID=UPI003DA18DBB
MASMTERAADQGAPPRIDTTGGHHAVRDREWRFLVNGELRGAVNGATFERISPFTRDAIATVPSGDAGDADVLAEAAWAAKKGWAKTPMPERIAAVTRAADIIEEHRDELAFLDAIDAGSTLANANMDIGLALAHMRLFAGIAMELKGTTIPASRGLHLTVREPVGVVVRIVPFNHPFMFAAKVFTAILAGCPVILKSPEVAPLSALRLGELMRDVFPAGVLQVSTARGRALADSLVRHKRVAKIAFIGSESTGAAISRAAAETGFKRVSLELGGKNAMIVFDDADLDKAAQGAIAGMNFTWSGQSCGSNSRLLVQRGIHDRLVERIAQNLEGHRLGDPLDPEAQQGTVIHERHYDTVMGYIDQARAEGGTIVTGGEKPADPALGDGLFVPPTVITGLPLDGRVVTEEIFGPVLSVIPFDTEEEALEIANALDYGLTASVWTSDIGRALRVVHDVEAGFTWINDSSKHFLNVPYGGVKSSGMGREESMEELLSYTELKTINITY